MNKYYSIQSINKSCNKNLLNTNVEHFRILNESKANQFVVKAYTDSKNGTEFPGLSCETSLFKQAFSIFEHVFMLLRGVFHTSKQLTDLIEETQENLTSSGGIEDLMHSLKELITVS